MLKKITKLETEDVKVFDTQKEAEDYVFEQGKEVMTHTSTEQLEALRLADQLRDMSSQYKSPSHEKGVINGAIQELRSQHARIAELEAQLAAAQQGPDVKVIDLLEKSGDVRLSRCRLGTIKGQIRWDVEFGHDGIEVRGKTLQEAIVKALAVQVKQGEQP